MIAKVPVRADAVQSPRTASPSCSRLIALWRRQTLRRTPTGPADVLGILGPNRHERLHEWPDAFLLEGRVREQASELAAAR